MKKKTCPVCGDEFEGRTDKRFCTDYCRSDFNNSLRSSYKKTMRHINQTLHHNRNILFQLKKAGVSKTSKAGMLKAGFNFTYFTNQYITNSGIVYYYCYDFGYRLLNENLDVLVVQKQDYVA